MAGKRRGSNEGSIFQERPGKWRASISVGRKNGRRIRKTFTALTRREVQQKLTKALRDQQLGINIEPPEKLEATKVRSPLAPRTVQHIHATLRVALAQAERWNIIPRNVASLVDAPRVPRHQIRLFTPEQARHFLSSIAVDRLEALYSVAIAIGLRQGEALGLRWAEDVDLENGTISVAHALQRIGGKLRLVETKRDRSRRTIILPKVCVSALLKHKVRQDQERMAAIEVWKESGFVFTTSIGTPLDGPTVTHKFQQALKAAKLPRMRFHDLRHTCATLLLAPGVHPRVVMEILGHSQIAVTMNTYSHVIPPMQRLVANQMDEILKPVATPIATFSETAEAP